jgi:hypothetical protein
VDVETQQVIALHCAGVNAEKRNYAVPLWSLAQDEQLLKAGVNYQ